MTTSELQTVPAGTWSVDRVHSTVGFSVEYMAGTFAGTFSGIAKTTDHSEKCTVRPVDQFHIATHAAHGPKSGHPLEQTRRERSPGHVVQPVNTEYRLRGRTYVGDRDARVVAKGALPTNGVKHLTARRQVANAGFHYAIHFEADQH